MIASGGVLLGLLVGVRHAFEPDHVTAVSTLAIEARGARRGTILGAIWGLGHTAALVMVYIVLFGLGSILGMAIASGAVGASLHRVAHTSQRRRAFAIASGVLSIGLGIAWAIPELGAMA